MKRFGITLVLASCVLTASGTAHSAPEKYVRAQFHNKKKLFKRCGSGTFFDLLTGSCWSCPGGYRRTIHPVKSSKACIIASKSLLGRIKQGVSKAASAIKKGVSSVASKVGKAGKKAVGFFARTGRALGAKIKKVAGKTLGKGFSFAKKIFCKTVGKIFCQFITLLKGAKTFVQRAVKHGLRKAFRMTIDDIKKALKAKADRVATEAKKVFSGFSDVLTAKSYSFKRIGNFAKTAFFSLRKIADELLTPLVPFPFDQISSALVGGIGAGALTPALAAIAALHFGLKKLLSFIVPKMVLGVGAAFKFINDRLPKGFKTFVDKVLKALTGSGGGILAAALALSKPDRRARFEGMMMRVANVAGRIQQGLSGAVSSAISTQGGSFDAAERALERKRPDPNKEMTKEELSQMVDGLADWAKMELTMALENPFQRLMSMMTSGLNRLVDIPRNALVAAVGSIPAVGGVLSSALNVGLGLIVELAMQFLVQQARGILDKVVGDIVGTVKDAVKKAMFKDEKSQERGAGFAELVKLVHKLASAATKVVGDANAMQQSLFGQMVFASAGSFARRGARDPEVRRIFDSAIQRLSARFAPPPGGTAVPAAGGSTSKKKAGKRRGLFSKGRKQPPPPNLSQAATELVNQTSQPLAQLVGRSITDAGLRGEVTNGFKSVMQAVASGNAIRRAMSNPKGFLTSVATRLLGRIKPKLIAYLSKGVSGSDVRQALESAASKLGRTVRREGFSLLTRFSGLLKQLGTAAAQKLYAAFRRLLGKNCSGALAKLKSMSQLIAKVAPSLKTKIDGAVGELSAKCTGAGRTR